MSSRPMVDSDGVADVGEMKSTARRSPVCDSRMPDNHADRRADSDCFNIRCVVERTKAGCDVDGSSGDWHVEVDTCAVIPHSLPFHELPYFALRHFGYTEAEIVGCKANIEIKNWKPVTFETVTEDFSATVEWILGDVASLITVRIRLSRSSQHRVLEDIKQKLLMFLLQHADDLLEKAGCPVKKAVLNQLACDDSSASKTLKLDDVKASFDIWLHQQGEPNMSSSKCFSIPRTGAKIATSPISGLSNGHLVGPVRTWFDPVTEIPLLQRWLSENRHPSRSDMVNYARELNARPHRRPPHRPLDLANIAYWFKNARARSSVTRSNGDLFDKQADVSSDAKCSESSPRDTDADNAMESSCSEVSDSDVGGGGQIPELPNQNAVYMVKPLIGHSVASERVEVVDIGAENVDTNSQDASRHRNTSMLSFKNSGFKRKRRDSWKSDENHNRRCSSSSSSVVTEEDTATDLSVRSIDGTQVDGNGGVRTTSLTSDPSLQSNENTDHCMKQETNGTTCRFPLHPVLSPAVTTNFPFPPHLQHLQMQMAMMTQAAMRYMHPMYSGVAIPPAGPIVPNRHPVFPLLPTTPACDDDGNLDSSSSINGEMASGGADNRRKRSRVFIDPLSEIPRLEQWFCQDSHPSSGAIERITDELNQSAYRQRFPKLEPKNVQLWFKNHRAKVKRQSVDCSPPTNGYASLPLSPYMANAGFVAKDEKIPVAQDGNGDGRFAIHPMLTTVDANGSD